MYIHQETLSKKPFITLLLCSFLQRFYDRSPWIINPRQPLGIYEDGPHIPPARLQVLLIVQCDRNLYFR